MLAKIPRLQSIESDILADGSLDYPNDILARFDFVREAQTQRILQAVANPCTTILGHRPDDTVGIAGNAGGLGILIGDGQLPNPGLEKIFETYF